VAVPDGWRASPPRRIPSAVAASPKAMYSDIIAFVSSSVALA
jgi:hypothetical protein